MKQLYTNLGRSRFLGEHRASNVEGARWVRLTPPGSLVVGLHTGPGRIIGASYVPAEDTTICSEIYLQPSIPSTILDITPSSPSSLPVFFTFASLRNTMTLSVCKAHKRVTGMLVEHCNGTADVVGLWVVDGATHNTIYRLERHGSLVAVMFILVGSRRRCSATGFPTPNEFLTVCCVVDWGVRGLHRRVGRGAADR